MSQSGCHIRECRESELELLVDLIHRMLDACYTGVYPPKVIEFFKEYHTVEDVRERFEKGVVLVAELDGKLVGTGSLFGNEILGVFIEKELQGRGCGKAIMSELEARALARGCDTVKLCISLPSKGFYDRLGYETLCEKSHHVGEGQHLDYWEAEKCLSD